ncbi:hypothetical protein F4679DRAFT_590488 [Xylaria curta]|nr:hypothetical protein F4679DRAFT_590488 [Xylaria curta]
MALLSIGWDTHRLFVEKFPGTSAVTNLEICSLKCHRLEEELKQKLIHRGEKFGSLSGNYHVSYNGLAAHVDAMASIFSNPEQNDQMTLTFEELLLFAEHVRVSLYSLGAGELGSDARDTEDTIEKVFSIVTKWKAILLLDEADVFLEKRTIDGLIRNRVYSFACSNITSMFMTTNRIQAIDLAFESRIHMTINYPDIDASTRKAIWSNFLGIAKQPARISDPEIACLAENVMNGRQTKNVLKIATLLASRSGSLLAMEHIQMALQVIQSHANTTV